MDLDVPTLLKAVYQSSCRNTLANVQVRQNPDIRLLSTDELTGKALDRSVSVPLRAVSHNLRTTFTYQLEL